MSDAKENETKAKWKIFWNRFQKRYPIANVLRSQFTDKLEEAWQDISTYAGRELHGSISVTKDGEIKATQLDWLFFGIICEFMNEVAKSLVEDNSKNLKDSIEKIREDNEKIIKELSKTIDEFDNMKKDLKDMMEDWKEGKSYRDALK